MATKKIKCDCCNEIFTVVGKIRQEEWQDNADETLPDIEIMHFVKDVFTCDLTTCPKCLYDKKQKALATVAADFCCDPIKDDIMRQVLEDVDGWYFVEDAGGCCVSSRMSFCPYCGKNLPASSNTTPKTQGDS